MDGRPGPIAGVVRLGLNTLAVLYDMGLEAYLAAEHIGLRRRTRLPVPVVSIGNLTVGGTGKTPMAQWLCRALLKQGRRLGLLSRGHGGQGSNVRIVSDGTGQVLLTAAEAGDEPCLLARTLLDVPVLVGKDRRLSGAEAIKQFAPNVLVLDDGFQYWQLARDVDIVLLDARRPFHNGRPLPAGLLREPMRHLARAQIVVVTRADALNAEGRARLSARVAKLAPRALLFWARHVPTGIVAIHDLNGCVRPLAELDGRRVVAVSGIAQPDSFARTLTDAGADICAHLVYADHAVYGEIDVVQARQMITGTGADLIIMTEKDAVKWPVSGLPALALRVEMQIENEAGFMDAIGQFITGVGA